MTMYTHLEQNLNFIMLSKHKIVLSPGVVRAGRQVGGAHAHGQRARRVGQVQVLRVPHPLRAARQRQLQPERDLLADHLLVWNATSCYCYCCCLAHTYGIGEGGMVLEASRSFEVIVAISLTLIGMERERWC